MCEITPEWISVIATSIAAVAAIAASITAVLAYKFQHNLKKTKGKIARNKILLNSLQSLLVTYANIHAVAKDEWSQERSNKLSALSKELSHEIIFISSLSEDIGEQLNDWEHEKDNEGSSVPYVIHMILGQYGAIIENKYDDFLARKAGELRAIQDQLFEAMSA